MESSGGLELSTSDLQLQKVAVTALVPEIIIQEAKLARINHLNIGLEHHRDSILR